MGKVDIWFPFYVSDYISDTMALTVIEHGIYLLLMIHCWKKGQAPKDPEKLKAITKTGDAEIPIVLGVLNEHFEEHDTFYISKRLMEEKTKAEERRERASRNGKLGGRPSNRATTKKQFDKDWYEMILFFKNKCLCCGEQFPDDMMPTMDHVIPKSFGGEKEIKNVQPLCFNCNREKSNNHTTDYRLDCFDNIPENLRTKWFSVGKINKTLSLLEEKQNETTSKSPSPSPLKTPKPKVTKHKHGQTNKVLLTDEELLRLENDYGKEESQKMIETLDYSIDTKGYTYKNHNRVMRKWAGPPVRLNVPPLDESPAEKELKKLRGYLDDPMWPDKAKEEFKIKIAELEEVVYG